ncbi:MAG: hypothetical protein IBJ00_03230 [Alphaproteobacteria bacterium]|nr:hypothetical protein [Alphaproteobacteria bacterium]
MNVSVGWFAEALMQPILGNTGKTYSNAFLILDDFDRIIESKDKTLVNSFCLDYLDPSKKFISSHPYFKADVYIRDLIIIITANKKIPADPFYDALRTRIKEIKFPTLSQSTREDIINQRTIPSSIMKLYHIPSHVKIVYRSPNTLEIKSSAYPNFSKSVQFNIDTINLRNIEEAIDATVNKSLKEFIGPSNSIRRNTLIDNSNQQPPYNVRLNRYSVSSPIRVSPQRFEGSTAVVRRSNSNIPLQPRRLSSFDSATTSCFNQSSENIRSQVNSPQLRLSKISSLLPSNPADIPSSSKPTSLTLSGGTYTITNRNINPGTLCYTNKASRSGHYTQILEENKYYYEKAYDQQKYEVGGVWRDTILWEITPVEDGYYTIKNRTITPGNLSYTNEESRSGHYAQILQAGKHFYEKANRKQKYEKDGKWRSTILWYVKRVE